MEGSPDRLCLTNKYKAEILCYAFSPQAIRLIILLLPDLSFLEVSLILSPMSFHSSSFLSKPTAATWAFYLALGALFF